MLSWAGAGPGGAQGNPIYTTAGCMRVPVSVCTLVPGSSAHPHPHPQPRPKAGRPHGKILPSRPIAHVDMADLPFVLPFIIFVTSLTSTCTTHLHPRAVSDNTAHCRLLSQDWWSISSLTTPKVNVGVASCSTCLGVIQYPLDYTELR